AASTLVWLALPSAGAHADTTLIGWTAQADANPFDFVIDSVAGLAGVHPLAEADVPEDATDFETGPYGHALASLVWPGGTAGNLGSLSGQLGLPAQIAPLFAQANDPIRAETFYPAGPADATYPTGAGNNGVAEMVSHVDGNGATASSGLSDFGVNGLFQVQGIQGSSSSSAADQAVSKAAGSFSSLSILGGMITIGATASTASATSDGNVVHGQASTHIGAIAIMGQQVSVGNDGITVGPAQTNALGSLTNPLIQQANQFISTFHVTMTPLPETETSQSPTESITSAGLKIGLSLPSDLNLNLDCGSLIPPQASQLSVLCTLPGFLQGASLTVTVGRATATAIATPPFPIDLGGLGGAGGGLLGDAGGSATAAGAVAALSPDTGSAVPALSGTAVPTTGSSPSTAALPSPSRGNLGALTPVDLSHPVTAGLLALLLVLAVAAGAGIIRMGRQLDLAAPESVCPLEESP
ncbi:MAG TPA: hypothetical protein VFV02_14895, partial [Acidimicrobiales bacterium]|nr:hypothetical protein [Acidimicrobiales bacterium]